MLIGRQEYARYEVRDSRNTGDPANAGLRLSEGWRNVVIIAPDGPCSPAVKSVLDTRLWFDRLTIPSFVEGD